MKLQKKHKRLLAYVAILGGAALLALTFFTISQYEKAKYNASITVELRSKNKLDQILDEDANAITDETSKYHEAALYWDEVHTHFVHITEVNSAAYKGTAIPAYIFRGGSEGSYYVNWNGGEHNSQQQSFTVVLILGVPKDAE